MKKYIVITGASSGIGYATAKAFASRGKNLILVARRIKKLEDIKREIETTFPSVEVVVKSCDLSVVSNAHSLYNDLKSYQLETWINNAGFGDYSSVAEQNLQKIEDMLNLNITALTILSTLFIHDYKDVEGTQIINVSSRGGYVIVPNAVTYCATKYYVSAFTEGLAHELKETGAKMQAKVLAPAATKTEFGNQANNVDNYDYDESFGNYHTSDQMAGFLLNLYDSNKVVGIVNFETFEFDLENPRFTYAGNSSHNQKNSTKTTKEEFEKVIETFNIKDFL